MYYKVVYTGWEIKLKHACTARLIIQGEKLNLNKMYHKVNYEKTNLKHACSTILVHVPQC